MKREDLFQAIGEVDDDLLDENAQPAGNPIRKWIPALTGIAACAAVAVAAVTMLPQGKLPSQLPAAQTETETLATAQLTEEAYLSAGAQETQTAKVTGTAPPETTAPKQYTAEHLPDTENEAETAVHLPAQELTEGSTFTVPSTTQSLPSAETTTVTAAAELTAPPLSDVTFPESETAEEYSDWKSAYRSIIEEQEKEREDFGYAEEDFRTYSLENIDGDDVPELRIMGPGIIWLYTWEDGEIYPLMDGWGFGVMGNNGYGWIPGENKLHNYNSDYAGLIGYDTFFRFNEYHKLNIYLTLEVIYFNDLDGDGEPDVDEPNAFEDDSVTPHYYLVDGGTETEITEEEYNAYKADVDAYYDHGGDDPLEPSGMTYEEIMEALQ